MDKQKIINELDPDMVECRYCFKYYPIDELKLSLFGKLPVCSECLGIEREKVQSGHKPDNW